ncbi:MAG: transposase [Eubacteriaceae bacterium]|nr:transposase [Eubacteriaceae bacterium]
MWDGHLWNPSYFVATVSDRTLEQVKEYIDNQKVKWFKKGGARYGSIYNIQC